MERSEAEVIYEQGCDVVVAVLLRMDEQISGRARWTTSWSTGRRAATVDTSPVSRSATRLGSPSFMS
ncbi:MAG TPA: hypothetical protein VGG98_04180 [Solirubrobacteraceae bacterium]